MPPKAPVARNVINADTAKLTAAFLDKPVDYITINGVLPGAGHNQNKNADGVPLMHWRLNLVWFQDQAVGTDINKRKATGVVYDTVKDESPTVLEVDVEMRAKSDQGKINSETAKLVFATPMTSRSRSAVLTPKKFNELLHGKKHFHYENTANRSGCLHWVQIALKDLADAGYVAADAPAKFKADLATWRAAKTGTKFTNQIPADQGTFPLSNPTNPAP